MTFDFITTMKTLLVIFTLVLLLPLKPNAQEKPAFSMPVDCTLNKDCWIGNYVDVDPAPDSHKDFKCGAKTYEGHKGTDFAIKSTSAMQKGVDVFAAKNGKILRTRDGENDNPKTKEQYKAIQAANKDCGNGVIIDHGNGLLTYYCHLKQGSITVQPGEDVEEGQIIGQVGQSGFAQFPHLHFTVVWEGGHIDPFTGMLKDDGCGQYKSTLWKDNLKYNAFAHSDAGFAAHIPDFKNLTTNDQRETIAKESAKAFLFWASFYQIEKGDSVNITILDPNGKIFAQRDIIQDKNMARQHYYTGRKLTKRKLISGTYKARLILKKQGYSDETHEYSVKVQ